MMEERESQTLIHCFKYHPILFKLTTVCACATYHPISLGWQVVLTSLAKFILTVGFPTGSAVKNPPAMQKRQVRFLDQEDPPEEGMATHSSIFAGRIPWTEELRGLQSTGSTRSQK